MAETKENIEAKLAEYLEGTLDAAGRAEIEQHLLRNPEHRKLMADLGMAKAALRTMPRERPPADMTEMLQGQLERTALLGDALHEPAVAGRSNRWSQLMAIAAILILAVGLGLVVYIVLPSSHPEGFTVIEKEVQRDIGVAPPAGAVTRAQPDAASTDGGAGGGGAGGGGLAGEPKDAGKSAASDAATGGRAEVSVATKGGGPGEPVDVEADTDSGAVDGPRAEELVVVLASNDRGGDVESRLVNLLKENRLSWERVEQPREDFGWGTLIAGGAAAPNAVASPATSPPPAAPTAAPSMDPVPPLLATRDGEESPAAPAPRDEVLTKSGAHDAVSKASPAREAEGQARANEAALSDAARPSESPAQQLYPQQQGPYARQEAAGAQAQARQPSSVEVTAAPAEQQQRLAEQNRGGEPTQDGYTQRARNAADEQVAQQDLVQQQQQQQQAAVPQRQQRAQNQYVVRGISRQQASELVDSLQRDGGTQLAQVYEPGNLPRGREAVTNAGDLRQQTLGEITQPRDTYGTPSAAGLTPPATTQPIAVGETLTIEVKELNAPGVEPVARAQVEPDGRMKLQMLPQPVLAQGLSERELEQAIADRYRDADLIPQATVSVRRAAGAAAATQPAQADVPAAKREDRVDLVIVLDAADANARPPAASDVDPVDAPTTSPAPTTRPAPDPALPSP